MLLPCFQGSPSQCNIECPVISSKSMWKSTWQPLYNVGCFRFVGRHLELLVMSHPRQCEECYNGVFYHQNCWKPHANVKPSNFCTWFCKWTRFWQNFNCVSGFPAAILDFRCNTGQKISWRFVAQPLIGKVTKPFHFIPNGSAMPLKRSVWG